MASATGAQVLGNHSIEIVPELVQIDCGCVTEQCHSGVGANEAVPAKRCQFAHWDSVASHDERLALVELSHDLPTVVPQLSLGDLSGHSSSVARRATLEGVISS